MEDFVNEELGPKKAVKEIEVIAEIVKPKEAKTFKVLKAFTLDKKYLPGHFIVLDDEKIIEQLISNKFIK